MAHRPDHKHYGCAEHDDSQRQPPEKRAGLARSFPDRATKTEPAKEARRSSEQKDSRNPEGDCSRWNRGQTRADEEKRADRQEREPCSEGQIE